MGISRDPLALIEQAEAHAEVPDGAGNMRKQSRVHFNLLGVGSKKYDPYQGAYKCFTTFCQTQI